MIFVKVDDLKPGMRLGKPIYNKNGVLLYDRDTRITMQAIYGIKNFNLMGLYILEPAEPLPPLTQDDINFERFQTMAVFSIREDLQLISKGKKDKGLDWLCSLIIKNYGQLDHRINFVQSLRSEDDFVYKHVLNTAILTALISGHMGLSATRINSLVKAAILHDIGALKLSMNMADQSDDDDVRRTIKYNTAEILQYYSRVDQDVIQLVNQMQEMYCTEETGISESLKTNVNASILYVADTYDRMTAMKSHTQPTSEILAVRHLMEHEERFDAKVVQALMEAINILVPGVCVELTNGSKGLVIRENEENIFESLVLNFWDNQLYDLSLPAVNREVQIRDVMKTMDNRIKLDVDKLKEYQQ